MKTLFERMGEAQAMTDTRDELRKPPKHKFWGAGEIDCPRDIKAGNGELKKLRCKVCGKTNPPDEFCWNASRTNDLLTSTIFLHSEGNRHVVELSFAHRDEAERIFEWLETRANTPTPSAGDVHELVVRLTELAVMELDADEDNTPQITAWGDAAEKEIRAFLASLPADGKLVEALIEEAARIAEQDNTPGYGPHKQDMEALAATQRRNIAQAIRRLNNGGDNVG